MLLRLRLECGEGRDFDEEVLHVEVGLEEGGVEVVEGIGTVSFHRLFGDVVEEFLNEGIVGLFVGDGEFGNIAGARKADLVAVVGDVFADRVDGFFVFGGTEAADGVELFEAEAQRINNRMTGLTGLGLG